MLWKRHCTTLMQFTLMNIDIKVFEIFNYVQRAILTHQSQKEKNYPFNECQLITII